MYNRNNNNRKLGYNRVILTNDQEILAWYATDRHLQMRHPHKVNNKTVNCVELGQKLTIPEDKKLQICHTGLHACLEIKDIFRYAPFDFKYLFRVSLSKEIIFGTDKLCAREREILWGINVRDLEINMKKFLLNEMLNLLKKKTHQKTLPKFIVKAIKGDPLIKKRDSGIHSVRDTMKLLGYYYDFDKNHFYRPSSLPISFRELYELTANHFLTDKFIAKLTGLIWSTPKLKKLKK